MGDTWVQRTSVEFAAVIAGELPTGDAWPRDPDGELMRWCAGNAMIWGDVEVKATLLLTVETDPRRTYLMLPDWERNFGLPDPCVPVVQTLPERRIALVNKMTIEGGQSIPFFEALAATLGYSIKIIEFKPFQFGLSSFGGSRGRMNPPGFRHVWRVRIGGARLTRFRFGASSFGRDSMLEVRKAEVLECMLRRWAPAHTQVIFDYHAADVVLSVKRFQFGKSRFGNDPMTQVVSTPLTS